jgi:hypothetical protein
MDEEARELTRDERAAINKLVISMCANFDQEYGCLPLENPCYMLGKHWTGSYCRYFRLYVLPNSPVLEATMTGRETPPKDICAACGGPFIPVGKQAYCSGTCAYNARLKRQRGYMRKRRAGC